jgi:hypothetical protein
MLYSWRVLLLPYIEEEPLYKEFHLDEPWDSAHNIRLLERIPAVYAPPRYKRSRLPPYHTVVHVFVGPFPSPLCPATQIHPPAAIGRGGSPVFNV